MAGIFWCFLVVSTNGKELYDVEDQTALIQFFQAIPMAQGMIYMIQTMNMNLEKTKQEKKFSSHKLLSSSLNHWIW